MTEGNILDFNTAARQDAPRPDAIDAEAVRDRLHSNPRAFIDWLFSGRAICNGREARVGDVYGTAGSSLSIALSGTDAGLWKDHATGEGGDLISLYMAYMGYANGNFQLALKEIASEFLGDAVEVKRASFQPSAVQRIAEKKAKLGDKPRADDLELGLHVAEWKYFDLSGNILASVKRFEPDGTPTTKTYRPYCFKLVDGERKWRPGAPELRPLYRLPEIALAQTVVLVEGEKCAQALADLGIDATTAMQGAEAPIDRTDWTPLTGKTIIIWPDNDDPGLAYARRVSERLTAIGCTVLGIEIPAGKRSKWDAADCIEEGDDPRAIIGAAIPVTVSLPSPVRLYRLDELANRPPPEWLIDGMLTESGLAMLWAPPESYKSFIAIDLAMCIATGMPFHGRPVKAGPVVYVAAEDDQGVTSRMLGWRATRGQGHPEPDIRIHADGMTLVSDDTSNLIQSLRSLPVMPRLVVIDTVARTFGVGDEGKTQDMNAFVKALDEIGRATKGLVMVIHHSGLNTDRERGNLALRAACNTIIAIVRDGERVSLVNTNPKGKQKNAGAFEDIRLRMSKVYFQQADTEVSTLVPMVDDAPPAEADEAENATDAALGKHQKAVLKVLRKADRPMGAMTLRASLNIDHRTLPKTLQALVERGLIVGEEDETTGDMKWSLFPV
jgi:DNA-binding HxlR family transcriptional regulator